MIRLSSYTNPPPYGGRNRPKAGGRVPVAFHIRTVLRGQRKRLGVSARWPQRAWSRTKSVQRMHDRFQYVSADLSPHILPNYCRPSIMKACVDSSIGDLASECI